MFVVCCALSIVLFVCWVLFDVCYASLSVECCVLLGDCCLMLSVVWRLLWLDVVRRLLVVDGCVVCCLLYVVRCLLAVVCGLMCVVFCVLFVVRFLLCVVCWLLRVGVCWLLRAVVWCV